MIAEVTDESADKYHHKHGTKVSFKRSQIVKGQELQIETVQGQTANVKPDTICRMYIIGFMGTLPKLLLRVILALLILPFAITSLTLAYIVDIIEVVIMAMDGGLTEMIRKINDSIDNWK